MVMRNLLLRAATLLALASATLLHAQAVSEIDPMLGADKGGNVFVGPTLPFGMAKPGPDYGNNQGNAGWRATGDLNGFSQLHVSGTGGGPKYGNILVQPQAGKADPAHSSAPREDEHAEVGYYSVKLGGSGIRAEVTTARRTHIYRFTYPATSDRTLLVDVGQDAGRPVADECLQNRPADPRGPARDHRGFSSKLAAVHQRPPHPDPA